MKKKFIYIQLLLLCILQALVACSDDLGNYTYTEKQVITIEGIPQQVSLLSGSEYIDVKPDVTSSIDGTLGDDSKDYSFLYQYKNSQGKWEDVATTKDLYRLATLSSGKHSFCFSVTDNRTGVKALKLFYVQSTTVTSEGYIVLCEEGPDAKVRVDMLSQISLDRIIPTHDVVRTTEDVPTMYRAASLGFYSNQTANRNQIVMMTGTGAYIIPTVDVQGYTEFATMAAYNEFKLSSFGIQPADHIIAYTPVPASINGKPEHDAIVCVSEEGNAFARNTKEVNGIFESPINTSRRGEAPEYRVAPFVGTTLKRPVEPDHGSALLFDTDNHRFVGWVGTDENSKQCLRPLSDPAGADKKFSFNTGSMTLVSMLSTAFSEGDVFCVMQDGAKRHIYVVNVSTDNFRQSGAYLDIQAPNFDRAKLFAASSQYPVIYYAYANTVYAYNYTTGEATAAVTLPEGEEVTMIKFNRIDHPWGVAFLCGNNAAKTEIYSARENRLIVGSFDSSVADGNGGTLRFYDVSTPGTQLSLYPGWEYKGYARIKDVVYKEIR